MAVSTNECTAKGKNVLLIYEFLKSWHGFNDCVKGLTGCFFAIE